MVQRHIDTTIYRSMLGYAKLPPEKLENLDIAPLVSKYNYSLIV
jgi:hypothetical protein